MTRKALVKTAIQMDTVVSIKIITSQIESEVLPRISKALEVFRLVEKACSRFDEKSELSFLLGKIGVPVKVSDTLFEAVHFSLEMAKFTNGIFDPTIGKSLIDYGFNINYQTGQKTRVLNDIDSASYQDVQVNEEERTILLRKPLILDLGAIAKGLAVDLAVKELEDFDDFLIDAGGDIFAKGCNEKGDPWKVGIRNPITNENSMISFHITNSAVCTSGSYERKSSVAKDMNHLINPLTGKSPSNLLSSTVIAPFTMVADAFSTVAFILGKDKGIEFLENAGLEGMVITNSLEVISTKGMDVYINEQE